MKTKLTENQKIGISLLGVGVLTVFTVLTTIPQGPNWFGKENKLHLGLDLQGGTHLVYQADTSKIPAADKQSAVDGVKDVIEKRINIFGVSEPLVQTSKVGDNYRVIIELPGVTDTKKAIAMIGETPLLEFKTQNSNPKITEDQKKEMDLYNEVAKKNIEDVKTQIKDGAKFDDLVKKYSQDQTTKDAGGDLGFIKENGPYPELYKEASTLKDSWFSWNTIETPEGYNLITRVSERSADKEVKAQHILICYKGATSCDKETTEADAKLKIEQLKADLSKIDSKNLETEFTKVAKANSTEPGASTSGGDLGWFSKGQMVKEFEDTAFTMNDNSVSDVVKTQFGFHLIYKNSERPLKEIDVKRILIKKLTEADYTSADAWINTELSGKYLKKSSVSFNNTTSEVEVTLSFDDKGKKMFADITEQNINKQVAIFLDGSIISAPTVRSAITGGEAVISGSFSLTEAKQLSMRLNSGALPIPISLINQQNVEPTLGQASVDKSLVAFIAGFIFVGLFMILYYRLPGLISVIALAVYALINISLFKTIPITLTLSGIAGFILSIGFAVDANVLIFERLKEELKSGKNLTAAINDGFKRAWLAIRDSNVTALVICLILYQLGTSSVKGFGLTLALGILTSMFTAITVTRILLLLIAKTKISNIKGLWKCIGYGKENK